MNIAVRKALEAGIGFVVAKGNGNMSIN